MRGIFGQGGGVTGGKGTRAYLVAVHGPGPGE